jgi:hypothetical protein
MKMVAERFVARGSVFVKICGEIKVDNAGMSNDKQCEKTLSPEV